MNIEIITSTQRIEFDNEIPNMDIDNYVYKTNCADFMNPLELHER